VPQLRLIAPAKVNLYLAVGGVRPDGYHDVLTVMQALELHDTVELSPAEALSVACEPDPGVPAEENLAWRAAEALGAALGREPAFRIVVGKRIPAGAGLGGGSADAAAVLAGIARFWGVPREDRRLLSVAASLGADVPFFLEGGCALLDGRGDRLVRRLRVPRLRLALVNPLVPVPTAAAYAAFDAAPQPAPPGPGAMLSALDSGDPGLVAAALYDNLTPAATALVPEVADALALVEAAPGVLGACMAGSGSTVFGVFRDPAGAARTVAAARERGWWAEVSATRDGGAGIDDTDEESE
jgi:4-diphosphocytidyl-2-C-methyl-D-erythritol kinase